MHIIKVGLDYRTAPVEIREKLSFSEDTVEKAMIALNKEKSILENVIISTCNRTEIYIVADQLHTGRYYVKNFLHDWFEEKDDIFLPYLQIIDKEPAVEHLFRLVAGLDSMVLGETQILGQVRDAFMLAQKAHTTGTVFNELFKRAITFAKKAHKETAIGEHAVSISYAAVKLAEQTLGSLENKDIAILGTGKMGTLALKNAQASYCRNIYILNRTFEKAEQLAAGDERVQARPIEELDEVLQNVELVITSTGASGVVITKADIERAQQKRKTTKDLHLIDIAVPRDIASDVRELENIHLFDVDSLQNIVDENLDARETAAAEIKMMVEKEIIEFYEWIQMLGIVPIISALRQKALDIQEVTLESIERKIPDLTTREKKVLNKHTKSIVNQLLKEPIKQAKELASSEASQESLSLFIDIFGIDEAIKTELIRKSTEEKRSVALRKQKKALSFTLPEQ